MLGMEERETPNTERQTLRGQREFGGQGEGGADFSAKLEKHFGSDLELLRFVPGPFLSRRLKSMVRICNVGNGHL
jgi:hypothetical protein